MTHDLPPGFRLGEHRFEPGERLLTGPQGACRLSPRAALVLARLARRPGEVVSRDDLEGGEGAAHTATGVSHSIAELRRALGDRSHAPRFIETVPGRGYRLLVEPSVADAPAEAAPGSLSPAPTRFAALVSALKRGGVAETGFAYIVFGWLAIQVADATFEPLRVPLWFNTYLTVLIIAGLPVALVLAALVEMSRARRAGRRPGPARAFVDRTVIAVGGALCLSAGGVYLYDQAFGLPGETEPAQARLATPTPIEPNSIAVLKFLNIDGSPAADVFANGLAEDVMSRLAAVPSLRVSARGDAYSLPANASSESVRERLRVRFYLEGSVQLSDRLLRVIIHLIDSETGFRVFSRSFSRDRSGLFGIQDEITRLTVANLRVVLPPDTQAAPGIYGEHPDIDAYVLYRHGMDVLHQPLSRATVREAVGWFRRSLALDPEFAAAHAGICMAYAQGFDVTAESGWIELAERACATAIDRNPHLDVVHAALGHLYAETGRDAQAEASFRQALEINANNVQALGGLADVYYRTRRLDEAEAAYRRAIGLQPGSAETYNALGWFLYQNGRYEEAADEFRRVLSLEPNNAQGYSNLGTALVLSGDFADAEPALLAAIRIEPRRDTYSNLGLLYYYLGEVDAAVAAQEKAAALAPNDHLAWANLGDALSLTPRHAETRAAFRKAEALADRKLAVNPMDAGTLIDLAWIKAMLGKQGEARGAIARARELTPSDPYVHFVGALISLRGGERRAAYADLHAAIEMGYPPRLLLAEPHLEPLRNEPEFAALTRDVRAARDSGT
ncbi:MAG TPA: tetratricopeptide repeat protein [Woeseiaceae bacterium]